MELNNFQKNLFRLGFRENSSNKKNLLLTIDDYAISITINTDNFSKSAINYGPKIKVHQSNICDFSKQENLVQLECVVRLLKKGYKPNVIELEKTYKLGHNEKGRLDIYIYL